MNEISQQKIYLENERLKNENEKLKKDFIFSQQEQRLTNDKVSALNSQLKISFDEQNLLNDRLKKVR